MNLPEKIIYKKAIDRFGINSQMIMAIQEMSELTKELTNYLIGRIERTQDVEGEIADVEIMLSQLKIIFDCEEDVKEAKEKKLLRLNKIIDSQND